MQEDISNSHTRPLEWRESGNNPLSVTLVLGIVQQLLESEPVNTQHTWILLHPRDLGAGEDGAAAFEQAVLMGKDAFRAL